MVKRRGRRIRRETGWTLVELLVVLSLVAVLASMAMSSYSTAVTRSREAVLKEDLFRMRDAIDQHFADRNEYPEGLQSLVTAGYLRTIPDDPFTGSNTSWQSIPADYDPSNPMVPGLFDVKSGAQGLAIDGSAYADW